MRRFRKSIFIPSILLVYLAVMAYMGRDKFLAGNYWEYFGIMLVTLLCIALLYFTLRKQEKIRERKQQELDKTQNQDKE